MRAELLGLHAAALLTSEVEPGVAELRGEGSGTVGHALMAALAGPSRQTAPPVPVTAVEREPIVAPIGVSAALAPPAIAPAEPIGATPASPTSVPATATSAPATAPTTPAAVVSPPATAVPATGTASIGTSPAAATSVPATATSVPTATSQPIPKVVLQATKTMPGGSNNYVAKAPFVKDLGKGFVVNGRVLDQTGQPVADTRLQIWLNTARGGEILASNRGSVRTDADGRYRLETLPVVPVFGQPHVHIAYDDGGYDTLFLRPVLKSERDTSITVDFVLGGA